MARNGRNIEIEFQSMLDQRSDQISHSCDVRPDDSGIWNTCKAWYLILLHLAMCIMLFVCLRVFVNGQDFQIGSPPSNFTLPLYQAQVTGLISLSLVLIRTLVGACSTLIVWRTIFVMLNGEGVTLKKLVHLQNYRLPVWSKGGRLFWSSWPAFVIILTWPSAFVAPLVNSAVTWIPETKLSSPRSKVDTQVLDGSKNWDFLTYSDQIARIIISATFMAGTDPVYAFDFSEVSPLRRYFFSEVNIPVNSSVDITIPYFSVELQWVDAANEIRFQHVGDPDYAGIIHPGVNYRGDGLVSILRNEIWSKNDTKPVIDNIFFEKKFVSVKLPTLDTRAPGPTVNRNMACPTASLFQEKLPNVTQKEKQYFDEYNNRWVGKDCFVVAEASITADKYQGKNCTVEPAGRNIYSATCIMKTSPDEIEADWISSLTIDFMSEIMRNIVMLHVSSSWMRDKSIEDNTSSMLHLAYHAAWSSLTIDQGRYTDSATIQRAIPVIRARVELSRMLIWLGLCSTLTLSAGLLFFGLRSTSTKVIRDPTLAALSIDLSEVAHSGLTYGLCNAVALSKEDKKIPKLKFADEHEGKESDKCRRRLVVCGQR